MATASKLFVVSVSLLEKQWIAKALDLQQKSLKRSLANEMAGSEIYELRHREIAALDSLISNVNAAKEA